MTQPPPQIEIIDLRHFTARQLRPILTQEAVLWRERLRWDYASSTELLLQYLDTQVLPGFVASLRGQLVGYCFCVYEGNKAVIGDIFVLPTAPFRLEITHTLARHLIEVLEAQPDIDRIEAQLLLYDTGVLAQPFLNTGFQVFPRLFLECDLQAEQPRPELAALPSSLDLCAWMPGFYQPTAELIHAAYQGHIDARINDQYRSLHGSLRFLHNIVRFPGCGVFDPSASWVLRDRQTKSLAGVILVSKIADGVAHVTQICVAPELRGKGLGRLLLMHCMEGLRARGLSALSLTVSEDNFDAVRLYTQAGFVRRLRFEALVLSKKPGQGRLQTPGPFQAEAAPPIQEAVERLTLALKKATPGHS
jgi:ribosomal protein S18 acetylase RimI-like enzyme